MLLGQTCEAAEASLGSQLSRLLRARRRLFQWEQICKLVIMRLVQQVAAQRHRSRRLCVRACVRATIRADMIMTHERGRAQALTSAHLLANTIICGADIFFVALCVCVSQPAGYIVSERAQMRSHDDTLRARARRSSRVVKTGSSLHLCLVALPRRRLHRRKPQIARQTRRVLLYTRQLGVDSTTAAFISRGSPACTRARARMMK